MPRKKGFDKRIKLTPEQRSDIFNAYHNLSEGRNSLARQYGVSPRTITFICHPEKLEENKLRFLERGGSKQYYDKEKHRIYTKEHRKHKMKLMRQENNK